jgi:DNA-directed RNA polymerase specialized sigma24 family protein
MAQGNRAQADDLIQQVFQAAIMSWAKIGYWDFGRQEVWLYGVLHHKAADAWRSWAWERPVPELILDRPHPPQDTFHDAMCSIALDRALRAVIKMPPVRHRVVCLRVLAGLSTREVASW